MKRATALLSITFLSQYTALASPVVPGLRGGPNSATLLTGQPSPEPPPVVGNLVPGSTPFGSWATTATPPAQGNSSEPLYQTNAIMDWEEPSYAPMTSTNNQVCAMAFHAPTSTEYSGSIRNSIQKVRFIANNGSPVDVTTPTVSSRSGKNMYCVNLQISGLANNSVVEVRAIGYPNTGQPIVLQGDPDADRFAWYRSQIVVANYSPTRYYLAPSGGGGSDSNNCTSGAPCLTIGRVKTVRGAGDWSNVEICLNAGSYTLNDSGSATAANGWVIVKPCPGVAKNNVTINNWDQTFNRFSIQGLLIRNAKNKTGPATSKIWIHDVNWDTVSGCLGSFDCQLLAPGYTPSTGGGRWIYLTDSFVKNGFNVASETMLYRNLHAETFNSDLGQNVKTMINVEVDDWDHYCCGMHPDLNQISNGFGARSHIVYGLTTLNPVRAQGLFASPTQTYAQGIRALDDVAYVDVTINNTVAGYNAVQFGPAASQGVGDNNNVFMWNLNITSGLNTLRDMSATNWVIIDSVCTGDTIGSYAGVIYYGSSTCD